MEINLKSISLTIPYKISIPSGKNPNNLKIRRINNSLKTKKGRFCPVHYTHKRVGKPFDSKFGTVKKFTHSAETSSSQ